MTPEERRVRVEYILKMARLGILAEPAYDREEWRAQQGEASASVDTMLASESVLRRDWDGPEEDAAWSDL
jgi:hypothetical protein